MIQLVTQAIPTYSIDLFNSKSVVAIQKIHLPFTPRKDRLIWVKDSKGHFSIRSVEAAKIKYKTGSCKG